MAFVAYWVVKVTDGLIFCFIDLGNEIKVSEAIRNGAYVNTKGDFSETVLHKAAQDGKVLDYLLLFLLQNSKLNISIVFPLYFKAMIELLIC